MDLVAVVIVGLAGWRIASLLLEEDGPFFVFEKFRRLIGIKPGIVTGFLPTLFTCVYCLSMWTSLTAYMIYVFLPDAAMIIAAAAVVILVDKAARQ